MKVEGSPGEDAIAMAKEYESLMRELNAYKFSSIYRYNVVLARLLVLNRQLIKWHKVTPSQFWSIRTWVILQFQYASYGLGLKLGKFIESTGFPFDTRN